MKARHMPRNNDANAAGESCDDVRSVVIHQGCLLEVDRDEEEDEEEEEAVEVEEYGYGGNLRV
ncbi:hypothetical protein L195_g024954 [Trifolium pratense]|uniref:Uncharacterized protein n=1 Tax=Trifolium pratense TaxID=57577 RepID=A0A2K3NF37_TRIPR|nr:hypothetical protein L195_g024954 [Trifolium pratense]